MTIKVPKIPKNAAPSRGFSNKSKKPRKKNLIAGSNNSTNSALNTPSTIRGNEFFSFVIILTIIYKVNIRKKNDISKLFTTFFHLFWILYHYFPPSTTLKIQLFKDNSKLFT